MPSERPDRRFDKLLPVPRWPTAEEAAGSRWFSPYRLRNTEVHERTWVPAMVPWRATPDGEVTPEVLAWYRRFAQGQPGVLVVEATGIRDIPSGPLLRAGHDRFLRGLAQLVETVKEASSGRTRLFIQLIDFLTIRRRPTKEKFFRSHLVLTQTCREQLAQREQEPFWLTAAESDVRERLLLLPDETLERILAPRDFESYLRGYRERVTDTQLPHVQALPSTLPTLFAQAAERCAKAGFDGVELHFAHAYTLASFLSPLNKRTDGYGGSPLNRVRLPLEVHAATRAAVPSSFIVGCRYLGDEVIPGGGRVEDAVFHGRAFAKAGLDFLSLSKGGKFEDAKVPKVGEAIYPYTGPSGHECMPTTSLPPPGPFGRNVSLAAAVRHAVRADGFSTPVITCGGIASFWQAEEILARGDADVVAAARQTLADPDWFRKLRLGQGEHVRRCLFTNYCEGLDQKHQAVTCQRWDRLPGDAARTLDGRRWNAPEWEPS